MFKLFRKDNFLADFWGNLQILKDLDSLNESKINILGKSGLLISAHKKNEFTRNIKVNMQSVLSEGDSSTGTSIELIEDSSDMYWLILKDIEEFEINNNDTKEKNQLKYFCSKYRIMDDKYSCQH